MACCITIASTIALILPITARITIPTSLPFLGSTISISVILTSTVTGGADALSARTFTQTGINASTGTWLMAGTPAIAGTITGRITVASTFGSARDSYGAITSAYPGDRVYITIALVLACPPAITGAGGAGTNTVAGTLRIRGTGAYPLCGTRPSTGTLTGAGTIVPAFRDRVSVKLSGENVPRKEFFPVFG